MLRRSPRSTRMRYVNLWSTIIARLIQMTCDFSQGCSLAPLLFIIIRDCTYTVFRLLDVIHKVPIRLSDREDTIAVFDYADDTAVYFRRRSDITKAIAPFQTYKGVAGIALNKSKFIVVVIEHNTTISADQMCGLTLLGPTYHCRYVEPHWSI